MFLSLVLYRIYPYVVEKMCGYNSAGCRVGLRVHFAGNFWRVDCHFVDDVAVTSVTPVTMPICEEWKKKLVTLAVTLLSCFDPVPSLCSVVVENHVAAGRALSKAVPPETSVVMRFADVQWVQRCNPTQYKQRIGGLDRYNVLEFLKYQLSNVVNGPSPR